MTATLEQQITRLFGDKDPATTIARFQASKITRYSLDEVLSALGLVIEAHNTFEAARNSVDTAIEAFVGGPDTPWYERHNWQKDAPADLVKAWELSFNSNEPVNAWSLVRHSKECFPLAAWQKEAKSQLSTAKKINGLLNGR